MAKAIFSLPRRGRESSGALPIHGYASLWGVADLNGDVVQAGAFADSLARTGAEGVRMLSQHDARAPVGVWDQIVEDDRGLFVRGRIEDWSAEARFAGASGSVPSRRSTLPLRPIKTLMPLQKARLHSSKHVKLFRYKLLIMITTD